MDRNNFGEEEYENRYGSPSVRRVWIEIGRREKCRRLSLVTLRAEGVDRNIQHTPLQSCVRVTLRAEGVDRNNAIGQSSNSVNVTLRAEGVDRNTSDSET